MSEPWVTIAEWADGPEGRNWEMASVHTSWPTSHYEWVVTLEATQEGHDPQGASWVTRHWEFYGDTPDEAAVLAAAESATIDLRCADCSVRLGEDANPGDFCVDCLAVIHEAELSPPAPKTEEPEHG